MKKFSEIFSKEKIKPNNKIEPLAEKYLSIIAGGGDCPPGQEFHEYYQNAGEEGGGHGPGGAFWEQMCRFPETSQGFGGPA